MLFQLKLGPLQHQPRGQMTPKAVKIQGLCGRPMLGFFLLRLRRKRPHCRAAEQHDELAPFT
jgi:hypothetical protein